LKNSFKNFFGVVWTILTEVPGWPDAPRKLRIKRLIPIALPAAVMLLLVLWSLAWRAPRIRAERVAHQPVMALEEEVTNLRLTYSEQQASEIAAHADEASHILLSDPNQLPATLEKLKEAARTFGWEATLNATAAPTPPAPTEAQIYFLPSRGKLVPIAGNAQPFSSLLACLEKLPSSDQWIDLIRLTLRADEQGRHTVEIYLRSACRVPNEKAPQ